MYAANGPGCDDGVGIGYVGGVSGSGDKRKGTERMIEIVMYADEWAMLGDEIALWIA